MKSLAEITLAGRDGVISPVWLTAATRLILKLRPLNQTRANVDEKVGGLLADSDNMRAHCTQRVPMLVIVQYPLADLRYLMEEKGGRIAIPNWLEDESDRDQFIRNFGRFGTRFAGGVKGVFGETNECDCSRGIRFRRDAAWIGEPRQILWPWFRRLYFDGIMTGRFELGFVTDRRWGGTFTARAGKYDVETLIQTLNAINVSIHGDDLDPAEETLFKLRSVLVRSYLSATTKHELRFRYPIHEVEETVVKIGSPVIYVQSWGPQEAITSPTARTVVDLTERSKFTLSYLTPPRLQSGESAIGIWIHRPAHSGISAGFERDLRVLVSRLSAEHFSLMHLASSVTAGKFQISNRDVFKDLLQRSILHLEKNGPVPNSIDNSPIDAAKDAVQVAKPGQADNLLQRLRELAIQQAAEKPKKTAMEYFREFLSIVAEAAAKAGIEVLLKGAVGS
jgi:hypothetical protein